MTQASTDEIKTLPNKRFSFNSPFTKEQTYALRLTNEGNKPVMWTIQSTCGDCLKFSKENGVLGATENVILTLTMGQFEYKKEANDRLTIEWIVIPDNGPTEFSMDYLQKMDIIKKKIIPIHYNI